MSGKDLFWAIGEVRDAWIADADTGAEDAPPKDYPLTLTVTECQKDGGRVEVQAVSGTLTVR